MATITVTPSISPSSLSISGTTQVSATISWTRPTIPAGAVVSSCILNGKATATMSKGSAIIKVNGTTVTSGSTFNINLGTANTTNSVTVTGVGGNKNANGTVTFSNLNYTVTYELKHTVTFVDWDGTVLKTQEVNDGSSATAPTDPIRDGYSFTGWDIDFSNVTSNLTVTAQYVEKVYTPLRVKESNGWTPILAVYKKINDIWVLQDNLETLFDANHNYTRMYPPAAILYSDGTLIFYNSERIDDSHGSIISKYTGWDKGIYAAETDVPWEEHDADIINVLFNYIKPQNTQYWFEDCSNITSIDLKNLDASNVTNINCMFRNCSSLVSLDLSGFDASNVTNMQLLFSGCTNLQTLDLSNFNTSNTTSIKSMFQDCSNLTSLDLSSFDTSSVQDMSFMFNNCMNLQMLDLSNFNTSNVTRTDAMFPLCSSLTSLDLSSFDTSNVTNMDEMFYSCTNLQTVYARTEADAERFRASSGFPSTATVIVGKPS